MHEIVANLHMHTRYSDGHCTHSEIAQAALRSEIDVVIITDHNVWVDGVDGYYGDDERKVLLLVGEEIHDQARQPQKNHLLVLGAGREMSTLSWNTQNLIDTVRQTGGYSYIAHPVDPTAPAVGEDDLSWVDWQVKGYTGIELWNQMSEFKSLLKSKLHAIFYAYNPRRIANSPFPEVLRKWDELLSSGQRLAAIAGSDAHALPASLGPLRRTLFPYEFHFKSINMHLLSVNSLAGDLDIDRFLVLEALARGRAFIGYDLPASTRGFRFSAQGYQQKAGMGEEVSSRNGVTIQIRLPMIAECQLIKDGEVVKTWDNRLNCTYITSQPGAYRVEVYIQYLGRRRGWIYSNPIYLR